MATILVVDDQDRYLELVQRALPAHRYLGPARCWEDVAGVLERRRSVDLVLLDVHLDLPVEQLLGFEEGMDQRRLDRLRQRQGLEVLQALRSRWPSLPVVLMTSEEGLRLERDAERLEAEEYTYFLDDDYVDVRSLSAQVESILASRAPQPSEGPIYWGESPSLARIRRRLEVLARGRLPVVLLGPTGTGKSLLARHFVHPRSRRKGRFVAVDLATVPAELTAAHLFGSVKGAYTGSVSDRKGAFEEANGGTLFLDEVGNLPAGAQKMLLGVLQESVVTRLGETRERHVDVKLVVATNEDLAQLVRDGRFRADLYMRLNPATAVHLPPLVERQVQWEELVRFCLDGALERPHFRELVADYRQVHALSGSEVRISINTEVPAQEPGVLWLHLPSRSLELLSRHHWPGNLRELAMTVENAALFALAEQTGVEGERLDVLVVRPKLVRDLLRATEPVQHAPGHGDSLGLTITLAPQETLNKVSKHCERQYFTWLYLREEGDFSAMARVLLGDEEHARKVQLRFNQLGLKVRDFKDRLG